MPKKVWVVDCGTSPSSEWTVGVFSSQEKAVAHIEASGGERPKHLDGSLADWWRGKDGDYNITEYELDNPDA